MDLDSIYERVLGKVINYLSYGLRTEKEISQRLNTYLSKTKLPEKDKNKLFNRVLNRLSGLDFIDDKKVLTTFTLALKNSTKPRNKKYIKDKLFKKGFTPEDINACLNEFGESYELTCALNDLDKKTRSTGDPRRIKKYLFGKGYSYDIVEKAFLKRFPDV